VNYHELNFEGIAGPTHMFSGLAEGNLASKTHAGKSSNPKQAALQCLDKIKRLYRLSFKEAIIPPQNRFSEEILHYYQIKDLKDDIQKIYDRDPQLLRKIFSSSSMWTANAATFSPAQDCNNARSSITIANLLSNEHRKHEAKHNYKFFQKAFANSPSIKIHPALEIHPDEGAANHNRFALKHSSKGIEVFVYGYKEDSEKNNFILPARQSFQACKSIANSHSLENVFFVQQSKEAINSGVFHNDVISTANLDYFLLHEKAFENQNEFLNQLSDKFFEINKSPLKFSLVKETEISLEDAVKSYLFNSQIIGEADQMTLIAPSECKENPKVYSFILKLVKDPNCPIQDVEFLSLKESMQNGGGPACLRLRLVLNDDEINNLAPGVLLNEEIIEGLEQWINRYYPETLIIENFLDIEFLQQLKNIFANSPLV
jgi:succinylarginine dihydrolase